MQCTNRRQHVVVEPFVIVLTYVKPRSAIVMADLVMKFHLAKLTLEIEFCDAVLERSFRGASSVTFEYATHQ